MFILLSICSFFPHQVFEECCDLSGKHSQVEEACGDFIVVLGQVTIPQVLQQLNIMLLVFHMCCKKQTFVSINTDNNTKKASIINAENLTTVDRLVLLL